MFRAFGRAHSICGGLEVKGHRGKSQGQVVCPLPTRYALHSQSFYHFPKWYHQMGAKASTDNPVSDITDSNYIIY